MNSKTMTKKLYKKQKGNCFYCKRKMVLLLWSSDKHKGLSKQEYKRLLDIYTSEPLRATIEHVIPISAGGDNMEGNLVSSCNRCNWFKGVIEHETYMEMVKSEYDLQLLEIRQETNKRFNKLTKRLNRRFKGLRNYLNESIGEI